MKFALTILVIFIASIAFDSKARDLNVKERISILNLEQTHEVQSHALSQIDTRKLSVGDFLSYKILKNSCKPVDKLVEDIKTESDDFADKSANLAAYMSVCSQSVVSLVHMGLGNY